MCSLQCKDVLVLRLQVCAVGFLHVDAMRLVCCFGNEMCRRVETHAQTIKGNQVCAQQRLLVRGCCRLCGAFVA
jgi:hypothetical protein